MKTLTQVSTEVRIGNEGQPVFYTTGYNQKLVEPALKEFTDKMFDIPCTHYYAKIDDVDCIIDSLKLEGGAIRANLRYYSDTLWEGYGSDLAEAFRRGKLFLGCEYEFDSDKPISPYYLGYDRIARECLCVSDQLSFVKFHMLYYYCEYEKKGFRRTIFKI